MNDNALTVVAEYNAVAEAEMAKSLLESAGIRAELEDEYMSSLYPTGVIPVRLLVAGEDLASARQILERR